MDSYLEKDISRYESKKEVPLFQFFFRKFQKSRGVMKSFYSILYKLFSNCNHIEMSKIRRLMKVYTSGTILYYDSILKLLLGKIVIYIKELLLGRKIEDTERNTVIGNNVWIGINSTIVGGLTIGNDVLIAPNTFVNQSVPDHSVVFGNPCIIKHRGQATEGYINRIV